MPSIVDVALQEFASYTNIDNEYSGAKYWGAYGFNTWVNWCACFTWWCMDQCGYVPSRSNKFAGVQVGVNWFQSNGKFSTTPSKGDLIFFKWTGDSICNHVGIVVDVTDTTVVTVEGNTDYNLGVNYGRLGKHTLQRNWSQIYGYGKLDDTGSTPYPTDARHTNAKIIWDFFKGKGWTEQSIAGLLGNMDTESDGIQVDLVQYGGTFPEDGYGLVQWTPATKLVDWCNANGFQYNTITGQLNRIEYERQSGIQLTPSATYSHTWSDFVALTDIELATRVFVTNYERPYSISATIAKRISDANYWYNILNGTATTGNTPITTTDNMYHLLMMLMSNAVNGWGD